MQCSFLKHDKSQCGAHAVSGSNYCFFHNPDIDDSEKRHAQSRGGQNNAIRVQEPLAPVTINEPKDVISLLEETINQVRAGEIDVKVGNCIGVLSGQLIRALEASQIQSRVEVIERAILEKRTSYN